MSEPRVNAFQCPPYSVITGRVTSHLLQLPSGQLKDDPHAHARARARTHTHTPTHTWGMVLAAYAGPMRPAAALHDNVLCLMIDIH